MSTHMYAPPTPSPDGAAPTPTATTVAPGPTPSSLPQTGAGDGAVPWLLIIAVLLIGIGAFAILRTTRRAR